MGQRLVIQIFDKGERLANCYYHWNGYTYCSAQITEGLIDSYDQMKDKTFNEDHKKDMFIMAINMLASTGAGIQDEEEMNYIKQFLEEDDEDNFDFDFFEGRNEGLICVTNDGMDCSLDWSEATVNIDIGNRIVNFQAYCLFDYKEYFDDRSWDLLEELDIGVASQEMIDRDTNKVNEYYNEGLISERSKNHLIEELNKRCFCLKKPAKLDDIELGFELNEIPFEHFYKVENMFQSEYEYNDFEFTINGNKEQIISMIE